MLKIAALIIGSLTVVTIAPARSTNFQVEREARHQGGRTSPTINEKLYAEKILPIKKSTKLVPTVKATSPKVPADRQPEPSPANREPQPVKSQSQRELEDRSWLRPNERPINIWDNSANGKGFSGFGNFHNVNR